MLFDHVGSGGSDPAAWDADRYASLDGYADDILELVRELDLRDITFVGHSVAAMMGVLAVAADADRFAKLAAHPSPSYLDDDGYRGGFTRSDIDELLASMEATTWGGRGRWRPTSWARRTAPNWATNSPNPSAGPTRRWPRCSRAPRSCPTIGLTATGFGADVGHRVRARHAGAARSAPTSIGTSTAVGWSRSTRRDTAHSSVPAVTADAIAAFAGACVTDASVETILPWSRISTRTRRAASSRCRPTDSSRPSTRRSPAGWTTSPRIVGRAFLELLTAGGRIHFETHFAPLLHVAGQLGGVTLDLVASDGRRLPAFVTANVKSDDDGRPQSVRLIAQDAGDRRSYERELLDERRRAEAARARAEELATTLRRSLLPPSLSPPAGLDASAYYHAASPSEVGGDFYDLFALSREKAAFFLGDVCGKGVDAATLTSLARYTLRAAAVNHDHPEAVLHSWTRCFEANQAVTTPAATAR